MPCASSDYVPRCHRLSPPHATLNTRRPGPRAQPPPSNSANTPHPKVRRETEMYIESVGKAKAARAIEARKSEKRKADGLGEVCWHAKICWCCTTRIQIIQPTRTDRHPPASQDTAGASDAKLAKKRVRQRKAIV